MIDRRLIHNFDWGLLLIVVLLGAIGLTTVYSAVTPIPPAPEGSVLQADDLVCDWVHRHGGILFFQLPAARPLGASHLHRLRSAAAGVVVFGKFAEAPGAGSFSGRFTFNPPN